MAKQHGMAAALMGLGLVGCGGAQLVQQSPLGGQVVLRGGYMPAMAEARLLAAEHCGGRFTAVEGRDGLRFTCGTLDLESPAGARLVALGR